MSREGSERLTTNRVAERAGVSIGSVYQYFPNKEALVAEVRRRYDEAFRNRMLGLFGSIAPLPLEEAVARCVRELIAIHAADPELHNAISSARIDDNERRLLLPVLTSWLETRRDEIRRPNRMLAAAIALDVAEALIHGVACSEPERLADEEFAAEVTDLLVRYLIK